jgi:hypothetical protein
MQCIRAVVLSVVFCGAVTQGLAQPANDCPRTTSQDPFFGSWRPGWYGGEGLAVTLSEDGVWSTTAQGAAIAEKVFWWSSAFRLGTESSLKVEIKNLMAAPMTARISKPTNAYLGELERLNESELYRVTGSFEKDKWVMLVGIDFPDPGCWQITGEYLGQKLTFVVKTVRAVTLVPH